MSLIDARGLHVLLDAAANGYEPKVSHAPGSPLSNPVVSQCWRCAEEPCVQSSDTIVPIARRY